MHANSKHNMPLEKEYYWGPKNGKPLWAKCDMVMTDLDSVASSTSTPSSREGQNHLPVPELGRNDLRRVRLGVANAIDLDALIVPEAKEELAGYLKRFRARFDQVPQAQEEARLRSALTAAGSGCAPQLPG